MIDKLKYLIDECENKPKLKELLLGIASLPEKEQEPVLQMVEFVLRGEKIL